MRRLISLWKSRQDDTASSRISWKGYLAFFCATFFSVCAGAIYFKADQIKAELTAFSVAQGFSLTSIEVTGRNHTDPAALRAVLSDWQSTSIFTADLHAIRERLLSLGWVKDAVVSRQLPDRLNVSLLERQPAALLQTQNGHQLIDRDGTAITGADVSAFSHLVVVSGKGAAKRAAALLDMLQSEPEIFVDVWAVQLVSQRRWDVHMRSGLTIKLPEQDPVMAWSRLAKLERDTAITARDLASIDLRVPGQLIVKPNIPIRGKGSKT